jgi:hypothetical protein
MRFEDPLEWDRQIRQCSQLADRYRRTLKADPVSADPSGPFVGVPFVTTRAAFADIRAMPEILPMREPLLRWAFQLADARVNAELERHLARAWRLETIVIDTSRPIRTTRADLLTRSLSDSLARGMWLEELGRQLDGMTDWVSLLWQRRDELAKRAGFDGLAAAIEPVDSLDACVGRWLLKSTAAARAAWPRDPLAYLEISLSNGAREGWPAHVTAQSIVSLLGTRAWFARSVSEPRWPRLIGPTSFLRALYRLGRELARSWAASTHPFVIAHEAGGLTEHRFGWLMASLALNRDWQQRILGVNKDRAREQVRDLSRAFLCRGHGLCLKTRLTRAAANSSASLKSAFAENMHEVLGFDLPSAFAGQLPQLELDSAQCLVGFWLGCSDHARLRCTFEADWFRNPRAIETVLEESGLVRSVPLGPENIENHQAAASAWLLECLEGC